MWFWSLGVMIVNSYVIYRTFSLANGINKKDLMSHHDFRKSIALHWINQSEVTEEDNESRSSRSASLSSKRSIPRRPIVRMSESVTSSLSRLSNSRAPQNRARRVTSTSMDPVKGKHLVRLDSTLDHIPEGVDKKSKARCMLYRWFGVETQAKILHCVACNVNLCAHCYKIYHTVENLDTCKRVVLNN